MTQAIYFDKKIGKFILLQNGSYYEVPIVNSLQIDGKALTMGLLKTMLRRQKIKTILNEL